MIVKLKSLRNSKGALVPLFYFFPAKFAKVTELKLKRLKLSEKRYFRQISSPS
ncbi:hypothetical protein HMPREF1557_01560 [Streptococcus sobrinus W1703]|uniref:Uncharacterized protein n=1 Tax=Streptococcus sobrinus W1703 TaxID=1227275 RepID=U2KBN6_9STRE|nr:hypothetical protein HMPREF1557_01560 [Streptococcus sobrinus W1703]